MCLKIHDQTGQDKNAQHACRCGGRCKKNQKYQSQTLTQQAVKAKSKEGGHELKKA